MSDSNADLPPASGFRFGAAERPCENAGGGGAGGPPGGGGGGAGGGGGGGTGMAWVSG